MRAPCVLTGPLGCSGMASSAHEQHPVSSDGEVCSHAARAFCVAGLTGSHSLPFRRSGVAFFACWSDLETQLAAQPPPLDACSQRQEPCAPRATAGRCWTRGSSVHGRPSSTAVRSLRPGRWRYVGCPGAPGAQLELGARCALCPGSGTVSAVAWFACGCGGPSSRAYAGTAKGV